MRNFSKHILLSSITIITAIIIIVLLVLSNYIPKDGGGFKRSFLKERLHFLKSISLPKAARSIAGYLHNNLYFETDSAGVILVEDSSFNSFYLIRFIIPQNDQINSLYNTIIDSSSIRIAAGNIPGIYVFDSFKRASIILIKNKFTRYVQISPGTFVLRSFKKIRGELNQEFIKQYIDGDSIKEENNISELTNDAGISTDGLLHYDAHTDLLLYVNYYSNNITCFDTNLNLVYKARTIDTITTPKLQTTSVAFDKTGRITNNTPVQDVNLFSYVHNGVLYVNSSIIADNEAKSDFYNNSIIDIYQIRNGSYKGSFYLPKYQNESAREFIITGDELLALYKSYVVHYEIKAMYKSSS